MARSRRRQSKKQRATGRTRASTSMTRRSGHVSLALAAARPEPPDLRFDEVSFVTVHNAYEREAAPPDARGFDQYVARLYDQLGIRGLELDFAEHPGQWAWSVSHEDRYVDTVYRQLGVYLRALWAWSIQHEPHDPMVVYLEPKSTLETGFAEHFDAYIAENFDLGRIFRPADLRGAAASLEAAARAGAWPTVGALRNRFLFVVSGDGAAARAVAARAESLCFGDRALSDAPGAIADTDDPRRLVVNLPTPELRKLMPIPIGVSETRWIEILDEVATMPWLLPRVYYCDEAGHVAQALAHGAWMLATNQPDTVMSRLDRVPYRPRVAPAGASGARAGARSGRAAKAARAGRGAKAAPVARRARRKAARKKAARKVGRKTARRRGGGN